MRQGRRALRSTCLAPRHRRTKSRRGPARLGRWSTPPAPPWSARRCRPPAAGRGRSPRPAAPAGHRHQPGRVLPAGGPAGAAGTTHGRASSCAPTAKNAQPRPWHPNPGQAAARCGHGDGVLISPCDGPRQRRRSRRIGEGQAHRSGRVRLRLKRGDRKLQDVEPATITALTGTCSHRPTQSRHEPPHVRLVAGRDDRWAPGPTSGRGRRVPNCQSRRADASGVRGDRADGRGWRLGRPGLQAGRRRPGRCRVRGR